MFQINPYEDNPFAPYPLGKVEDRKWDEYNFMYVNGHDNVFYDFWLHLLLFSYIQN